MKEVEVGMLESPVAIPGWRIDSSAGDAVGYVEREEKMERKALEGRCWEGWVFVLDLGLDSARWRVLWARGLVASEWMSGFEVDSTRNLIGREVDPGAGAAVEDRVVGAAVDADQGATQVGTERGNEVAI